MTTLIINQKTEDKFTLITPLLDPEMTEDNSEMNVDELANSVTDATALVNVYEFPSEYQLEFLIPGMDNSDIEIQVDDDILTISAETSQNDNNGQTTNIRRQEFTRNGFSRSFELPDNVNTEEILADYKNGLLTLSVPKVEEENPEETIEIIVE